ncbi:hypothetical protein SSYRP_v1c04580 [Spiroplasma syrphidicola EA-1]|uniref:Transmembrane protein n=1 Tax=Spiroplasma syrphidicola EA-1 TaxID=1276229 RepID=R4UIR2_9MOLU|nr:hypothetical protein [Spiroplasma syrphidicola]AGM26050.1 hypothetical protein SSYRP_v1c04580 [Spiroplasma syrphidicola EA-1]
MSSFYIKKFLIELVVITFSTIFILDFLIIIKLFPWELLLINLLILFLIPILLVISIPFNKYTNNTFNSIFAENIFVKSYYNFVWSKIGIMWLNIILRSVIIFSFALLSYFYYSFSVEKNQNSWSIFFLAFFTSLVPIEFKLYFILFNIPDNYLKKGKESIKQLYIVLSEAINYIQEKLENKELENKELENKELENYKNFIKFQILDSFIFKNSKFDFSIKIDIKILLSWIKIMKKTIDSYFFHYSDKENFSWDSYIMLLYFKTAKFENKI